MVELEVQKRVQSEREEQSWARSGIRERSRDSEAGRAYTLMLERVQQQMADIQRQGQEERERMAREMRERDALYQADTQRKQKAIDQLTEALSATLSRLPTTSPAVASGAAPPPPPGGGNAPGTERGEPSSRPKKEVTMHPASSHATSSRPTKTGPPAPPPGDDGGSDDESGSEEPSQETASPSSDAWGHADPPGEERRRSSQHRRPMGNETLPTPRREVSPKPTRGRPAVPDKRRMAPQGRQRGRLAAALAEAWGRLDETPGGSPLPPAGDRGPGLVARGIR